MENYKDLYKSKLLGICVPSKNGGVGADYMTYMLTAAEIGRYCGTTSLTWNMHVSSCLWTGDLADDLKMTASQRKTHNRRRAIHYKRIVKDGRHLRPAVFRGAARRRPGRRPSAPPRPGPTAAG